MISRKRQGAKGVQPKDSHPQGRRLAPELKHHGMVILLSLALWAPAALAQGDGDVLWQQALAQRARGEEGFEALLRQACEGGCAEACVDALSLTSDLAEQEELLRMARDGAPEDLEIRTLLARVFAARGNYLWAARELQALEQAGQDVHFELGYCLYHLNMHDQAAEHLEQAGRDGSAMAALYGAAALDSTGQSDEARQLLELAREDENTNIAEASELLLRSFRGGAGFERTWFSLRASAAFGYDSNPVLAPDDAPTNAGGLRMRFGLLMYTEPVATSRFLLGARARVSRDQSFDEQARAFDYTAVGADIYGRLALGGQEMSLSYGYSIGFLDGGQGVEEDDFYAYSESHAGTLSYSIPETENLATRLQLRSGWTTYHNRARTGAPLLFGLGQSVFFLDARIKLFVEVGMRSVWTRSPKYNRLGPTASLAFSILSPLWELELLGGWSFDWSLYRDSEGVELSFDFTRPEVRRRDTINTVYLELGRSFFDGHLRLGLRYRFYNSASTIPTFDYHRHVIDFALSGGM